MVHNCGETTCNTKFAQCHTLTLRTVSAIKHYIVSANKILGVTYIRKHASRWGSLVITRIG